MNSLSKILVTIGIIVALFLIYPVLTYFKQTGVNVILRILVYILMAGLIFGLFAVWKKPAGTKDSDSYK